MKHTLGALLWLLTCTVALALYMVAVNPPHIYTF